MLVRGQYDKHGEKVSPGVPASVRLVAGRSADQSPGSGALAGRSDQPAHGPRDGQSLLADVLRHRASSRRPRTSARRANGQAIPNCSTGWPASSSRSGWDVKAMQKLIVTCATYRQSSATTAEWAAKDPENRLLARGPRLRLQAEFIRDQALAISGLLNDRSAGQAFRPISRPACGKSWRRARTARTGRPRPTRRATARTSTAARCTPSGSGPRRRRRCPRSTPPTARPAPFAGRAPTRRCRPWS